MATSTDGMLRRRLGNKVKQKVIGDSSGRGAQDGTVEATSRGRHPEAPTASAALLGGKGADACPSVFVCGRGAVSRSDSGCTWSAKHSWRFLVLILVSSFVVGNPLLFQGLGWRSPKGIRGWQMFSTLGWRACAVRAAIHRPSGVGGEDARISTHTGIVCPRSDPTGPCTIDVNTYLSASAKRNLTRDLGSPMRVWLQTSPPDIQALAVQLCRAAPTKSPNIHITARCGDRVTGEWRAATDPAVNACGIRAYTLRDPQRLAALDAGAASGAWNYIHRILHPCENLAPMLALVTVSTLAAALVLQQRSSLKRALGWLNAKALGVASQQGSPRAVCLLRVAMAPVVWARFGAQLLPLERVAESVVMTSSQPSLSAAAPWGGALGTSLLCLTLLVSSFLMFIGYWSRASTAVTGASLVVLYYGYGVHGGYVELTHHHVHALVVVVAVLPLAPIGSAYSVDAFLSARSSKPATNLADLWGTAPLRLFLAVVYVASGMSKLSNLAWLRGDRLEMLFTFLYGGSSRSPQAPDVHTGGDVLLYAAFHGACIAAGCAVVILEFALALAVYVPRYRGRLLVLGIALHGIMYLTLSVYTFSAQVWALYLVVVDPADVSDAVDAVGGVNPMAEPRLPAVREAATTEVSAPSTRPVWLAYFAVVSVLITTVLLSCRQQDMAVHSPASRADAVPVRPGCNDTAQLHKYAESLGKTTFAPFSGGVDGFRSDEANTGYIDVHTPRDVALRWRIQGFNKGTHTAAKASPIVVNETIYVASDTGVLFAYTLSGQLVWSAVTAPSSFGIHGTPCVIRELGMVYVGAYDGALYAFSLRDGILQWRAQAGQYIGASPKCQPNFGPDMTHRVVVTVEYDPRYDGDSAHGAIVAHDASSGVELGRFEGLGHSHSTLAYDRATNRYVFGGNSGFVYIIDAASFENMHTVCLKPTEGTRGGDWAVKGPIAVFDGHAMFGSWDGNLYSVSMATGEIAWRYEIGRKVMSGAGIDADSRTVYVGAATYFVYAVDVDSGAERWRFKTGHSIIGSIAVTKNAIVFGSQDGKVYALDKAKGSLIWSHISGRTGQVTSTPAILRDGTVVFTSRSYRGADQCYGSCVVPGSLHLLRAADS